MQARAPKQKKARAKETSAPEKSKQRTAEQQAALDETDALLADIDEALQGVDNDLATKFVQKGGE